MASMRRLTWIAVFCLGSGLRAGAADAPPGEATRAEMREIFSALSDILPVCVSLDRLETPGARDTVRSGLAKIAAHADALAKHADGSQAELASRGEFLAGQARHAEARFAAGRAVDARFVALNLTESCVGCHSRLPSDKDAPFAAKLIDDSKLQDLSASERARLAIATRQFDRALDLYEAELTKPAATDGEFVRQPDLVEYLIVAVRVKRDPERAATLLGKLEAQKSTPPDLRRSLGPWRSTLRAEGKAVRETPSLARAHAFVDAGRRARPYQFSKAGLVDDLLASSVLHRLVEEPALAKPDRAEAYYLLGLTDAQVSSSPWLSDAAWYLESAIQTAPHSATARRAFDAYEDMTLLEWSGSAGTAIPDDVTRNLDRLRALAGASQP
jgi:hypothetical protein